MINVTGESDTAMTTGDLVSALKGILSHSVAWEFRYVGWRNCRYMWEKLQNCVEVKASQIATGPSC